jgi:hypothetical protein
MNENFGQKKLKGRDLVSKVDAYGRTAERNRVSGCGMDSTGSG